MRPHRLLGPIRIAALAFGAIVATAAVTRSATSELADRAKQAHLAGTPGYGKAISLIDVDGDGWEDVWDSNTNKAPASKTRPSSSRFFLNQKDGTFKPYDLGISDEDLEFTWGAAWADFDNDGDPDLLLASGGFLGDGALSLYENRWREMKKLVKISAGITTEKHHWWNASWADFDNDGCLDFAAIDGRGRAWIYRNGCDKTFREVARKLGIVGRFKDGKNPVWFDIDNDGDQDLYIAASRYHRLYRNDGEAGFVNVTRNLGGKFEPLPLVFAALAADFNRDGNLDLYLGRQASQDLIAFGRGDGTFQRAGKRIGIETKLYPDTSENTMGLGVGDIDNDGDLDVLIGTGGPDHANFDFAFCSRPSTEGAFGVAFDRCGAFARSHGETQTHGIAVGDLDQDGSNDVVFNLGGSPGFDAKSGADSRGLNTLYSHKGGNADTAQIRLRGVDSNRDAIGARIEVTVSPKEGPAQIFHYSVQSSQGFQSQNSSWQLIRLMGSKQAEVKIRWPSGRRTEHAIRAGERKILLERSTERK